LTATYIDTKLFKSMCLLRRWEENNQDDREIIKRRVLDLQTKTMHLLKEIQSEVHLQTPYPVTLRGMLNDEQTDFTALCQIVHWNQQWISDKNDSLKPTSSITCVRELPRPCNIREWTSFAYMFEKESGQVIQIPDPDHIEEYRCACVTEANELTLNPKAQPGGVLKGLKHPP